MTAKRSGQRRSGVLAAQIWTCASTISMAAPFLLPCASGEARNVDRLFGNEFEQRRHPLAGLGDAAAGRRHVLLGLGDALAVAAQRPSEIVVLAADIGRAILLG